MTLFHFKPVRFERKEKAIQKSFKPAGTRKEVRKYVETIIFSEKLGLSECLLWLLRSIKILRVHFWIQFSETIEDRGLRITVSIFIITQITGRDISTGLRNSHLNLGLKRRVENDFPNELAGYRILQKERTRPTYTSTYV